MEIQQLKTYLSGRIIYSPKEESDHLKNQIQNELSFEALQMVYKDLSDADQVGFTHRISKISWSEGGYLEVQFSSAITHLS